MPSRPLKRGDLAQVVKPWPLNDNGTYELVGFNSDQADIDQIPVNDILNIIVEIQADQVSRGDTVPAFVFTFNGAFWFYGTELRALDEAP